jgi:hypothetical protein
LVHCEPLFNVAGKAETRNANWIVFGFIFSRDRANTPLHSNSYTITTVIIADKVYQLLVHGRWFSPGTPASFITKAGRHDIAEILLEVALRTINQIESINHCIALHIWFTLSHSLMLLDKQKHGMPIG